MKERTQIVIFGTGGNCIDIVDIIDEMNDNGTGHYECVGFLDDNPDMHGKELAGLRVLGPLSMAEDLPENVKFVNGIGSDRSYLNKRTIISKMNVSLDRFETLIHPKASISKMSKLGRGVVVFPNVTISSNVKIGNHVIILPNSVISHDSSVGDYSCITSGVCISGNVIVGSDCYLGTNSSIRGNVSIGARCLIGMGSCILYDVKEESVMVGVPGKPIKRTL